MLPILDMVDINNIRSLCIKNWVWCCSVKLMLRKGTFGDFAAIFQRGTAFADMNLLP